MTVGFLHFCYNFVRSVLKRTELCTWNLLRRTRCVTQDSRSVFMKRVLLLQHHRDEFVNVSLRLDRNSSRREE